MAVVTQRLQIARILDRAAVGDFDDVIDFELLVASAPSALRFAK